MAKKNTVEIILAAKDRASKATKQAFGAVQSSAKAAFGAVKAASIAAAAAIGTVSAIIGKMGISYNAMMEQSKVAWTTLLGSAEEAQDMLKQISDFTKATPFETEHVDMMAKYMHNAGLEGKKLFDELLRVSDVASAFAIPAAEAKEMTRQMSQVRQAGVAYTEDLNVLQDRGVPIFKAIAEQQGIMVKDVKKMASEGKLSSDIYIEAFNNIAKGVEGASEAQSKTFNGMLSTLKDNIKIFSGAVTEGLFERLKGFLPPIIDLVERLTESFQNGGWKGVMSDFLSPGVANFIITSLNAVQEAFAFLKDTFIQNKTQIVGVFETIKSFIGAWVEYVKGIFSGDGNVGRSFVKMFETIKSIALPILQDAVSFIKGKFAEIKKFWDENGAQIIAAVQNFWAVISAIFQALAPVVLFIVKMLWDNVKGVINGALNIIMGLIKVFTGLFTGDFRKMWEGVKQLFIGAVEAVWNLLNLMFVGRILTLLKVLGKKMLTNVQYYWYVVKEGFTKLATGAKDKVVGMVNGILQWFGNLLVQFRTTFSLLRQFGENIFMALWNTLRSIASNIFHSVKGHFSNLFSSARGVFNNIWSSASSIFNRIKNAITAPIISAKNTVVGMINRIKNAFNFSWGIPKPRIPDVSVVMRKNSWGIPYPDFNVDWYDKGGVFTGPQIIGVGEKRPEFVGALDDLKDIVRGVFREEGGVSTTDGEVYEFTFNINLDGENFVKKTIRITARELERIKKRSSNAKGGR